MDSIKGRYELRSKLEDIGLDEGKWIVWLWIDVHTNNFEPSISISHSSPASTTKQVKQSRLRWPRLACENYLPLLMRLEQI